MQQHKQFARLTSTKLVDANTISSELRKLALSLHVSDMHDMSTDHAALELKLHAYATNAICIWLPHMRSHLYRYACVSTYRVHI